MELAHGLSHRGNTHYFCSEGRRLPAKTARLGHRLKTRKDRVRLCGEVVNVDLVWQCDHVIITLPLVVLKGKVSQCYTATKDEDIKKVIPLLN